MKELLYLRMQLHGNLAAVIGVQARNQGVEGGSNGSDEPPSRINLPI